MLASGETAVSPPTGTVTFLFTDIEGSTRLWEQHPEAMRRALAWHDDLLRRAVEEGGGYVFKTVGDSVCAGFAAAPPAVAAALCAQQALHRQDWDGIGALRVRMALHTGEAEARRLPSGWDYFGSTLSRVARLLDAGHGGQTLLSQAACNRVRHDLPRLAELRDLGAHGLKDLAQPEHVYQLLHPTLPADFPPVRSLEAQPNNLPLQLTSFIGREAEMHEARRLLQRTRLLTLTGPGGCGKTRLALQVAADYVGRYGDGVWLVELAARSDPKVVPQAVAQSLHVREELGRPLPLTLADYLRPKELLLVLDNCEHLIEACAHLATHLLSACPRVRILATSREALGVAGETTWPVPSLSLPDLDRLPPTDRLTEYEALRLFIERATSAVPAFTVNDRNVAALAQVCRRLDGIPLAIELAAARVKVLSLEQIAQRLDDRFRLLTGGSRTALPRQQTLRALIDWSWDLLSEQERTLLRRLAVVAGGWTLAAAEAVCAGPDIDQAEVLDLLSRLVDKSLVLAGLVWEGQAPDGLPEARYRLLETIRQYSAEKLLASGEAAALRARHRDWYLHLAEAAEPELRGPRQAAWFDRLEIEHDNLRAALEWSRAEEGGAETGLRLAGVLSRLWYVRGHLGEGRDWLHALLAQSPQSSPAVRAKALHAAGSLARDQGDYARAAALYEEAMALRRALGDRQGAATSLQQRGAVAFDQGDYEQAQALLAQSLRVFRDMGYKRGMAISLNYQGTVALYQADYGPATALLAESLALSREVGEKWGAALSLNNLGHVALSQGDYRRAAVLFRESQALYRETGDKRGIALSLGSLGEAAQCEGDHAQALALYKESLALYRGVGDKRGIATCLEGLAAVSQAGGLPDRAARLFGAAETLREAIGSPLPPAVCTDYDRDVASARAALEAEAFARAWAEGRAMALEQAVEYALAQAAGEMYQPLEVGFGKGGANHERQPGGPSRS